MKKWIGAMGLFLVMAALLFCLGINVVSLSELVVGRAGVSGTTSTQVEGEVSEYLFLTSLTSNISGSNLTVRGTGVTGAFGLSGYMDYIASTESDTNSKRIYNDVKYIAEDNRLVFCVSFFSTYQDNSEYGSGIWGSSALYSELAYALTFGGATAGEYNVSGYSTGVWYKDYYALQTVLYCILWDYGGDGVSFDSLYAVSGYEDVYQAAAALYAAVKAGAGSDGYGDSVSYTVSASSMEWTQEGDYLVSSLYTVSTSGSLTERSLSLEGAPEGSELVYTNEGSLTSSFRIRIPMSSLSSGEEVSFQIRVQAGFSRPVACLYQSLSGGQNVTLLENQLDSSWEQVLSVKLTAPVTEAEVYLTLSKLVNEEVCAGAVYGIYADADCTNELTRMTTKADGSCTSDGILTQYDDCGENGEILYYVREISAPTGVMLDETVYAVTVNVYENTTTSKAAKVNGGVVTDELWRAKVLLYKVDSVTGKTIEADALFSVYEWNGSEYVKSQSYEVVRRTDGVYEIRGSESYMEAGYLYYSESNQGKFRIVEEEAPEGYLLDGFSQEIILTDEVQSYTFVVEDTAQKRLVLEKYGEALSSYEGDFYYELIPLTGATFCLEDADGELLVRFALNEEGYWETVQVREDLYLYYEGEAGQVALALPYGDYVLYEEESPYGYVCNTRSYAFSVTEDGIFLEDADGILWDEETLTLTFVDERIRGIPEENSARTGVSLYKTDGETLFPVEGATYALYTQDAIYDYAGNLLVEAGALLATAVTNEEGMLVFELDLPCRSGHYGEEGYGTENSGCYLICELFAPEGYFFEEAVYQISLEDNRSNEPVVVLTAGATEWSTHIQITKCGPDGELVDGAVMTIKEKESGEVILTWVTAGTKDVVGLKFDTEYILIEEAPAEGYVTAEEILFVLREVSEGQLSIYRYDEETESWYETEGMSFYMVDEKTSLLIAKVDAESGEPVEGAVLQIWSEEGELLYEWTTQEEPFVLEGIAIGTYILHEAQAPEGYVTAEDIVFTVEDTVSVQYIEMTEEKEKEYPSGNQSDSDGPKTGDPGWLLWLFVAGGTGWMGIRVRKRFLQKR